MLLRGRVRMLVYGKHLAAARILPRATGLLLAGTGLTVWTGLSVWSGADPREAAFDFGEAWSTSAYYFFGVPVMATAVAIAAFRVPDRCWRWPLWLVAGHQLGVVFGGLGMQSGLSLFILVSIIALLLAPVFALPALLGSHLAHRYRAGEAAPNNYGYPEVTDAYGEARDYPFSNSSRPISIRRISDVPAPIS